MHTLTFATSFLALSSAFLLYGLTYDTRLIDQRVQMAERAAERARSEIAVLRAERAHLSRPDRIEPLARAMGMRPTLASQFTNTNLADADLAR
ncbi:MAG: cell division protein FtsL [Hyphomicrobiaceae bacterium]